jgi:pimeloyl-ACP methyl ester carboxylesterase
MAAMSLAAAFMPWASAGGSTQSVQLADAALRVHRLPATQPALGTLVFLHGWGMGAGAFHAQAPLAAQGFDLIAPDLPGFAATSPAPDSTIIGLARLVSEMLLVLGIDRPILVGWSMGASLAWLMAEAAPDQVGGIVSLDMTARIASAPGWSGSLAGGYGPQDCTRAVAAITSNWPAMCATLLARLTAHPDPDTRARLAMLAESANPEAAATAWESLARADLRHTLSSLPCPLLAVHGAASALYPPATLAALQQLAPQLETLVVPDTGHSPHIEAPDQVNAAIARFAKAALSPRRPVTADETH